MIKTYWCSSDKQDKAMDAFRGEYEKLFSALEKSHKNEKRLNTKCQELGSEIASQQSRVDAAKDKTHEDQVIILIEIMMYVLIHLALKINNSVAFFTPLYIFLPIGHHWKPPQGNR